jgi:hypothetical protein
MRRKDRNVTCLLVIVLISRLYIRFWTILVNILQRFPLLLLHLTTRC